ncbi:MAG: hypothetical protein ACKO25_11355 [Cyanobium sp.]
MNRTIAHSLSFVDLEGLVLVEEGGATPREVADSLRLDREETKALSYDLAHRGLLACQLESTTFPLTPLARTLRNAAAFIAALPGAKSYNPG